jgi:hypothetical protein
MADDLYTKFDDDQKEKTNTKWEILEFFKKNYILEKNILLNIRKI